MTILVVADDEGVVAKLPDAAVDLLISCGDLPDETILQCARKCRCGQIFAVKGNHDSSGVFPAPIIDLHGRVVSMDDIIFGGFCGSWKYKPKGNFLFEQEEVSSALDGFPKVDVFVTHNSPRGIHDRDDDVHLGFTAFNNYLSAVKVAYHLHGHQHVQRESNVGWTRVIGTYGFRYLAVSLG